MEYKVVYDNGIYYCFRFTITILIFCIYLIRPPPSPPPSEGMYDLEEKVDTLETRMESLLIVVILLFLVVLVLIPIIIYRTTLINYFFPICCSSNYANKNATKKKQRSFSANRRSNSRRNNAPTDRPRLEGRSNDGTIKADDTVITNGTAVTMNELQVIDVICLVMYSIIL